MSYILILGTILLGLFSLHKDWHNYKHPRVRKAVALVLIIVGAISFIKTYRDNRNAQITNTKATAAINTLQSEVAGLQGQVKAANDAQTRNTTLFLENFNRLSDKVRDLQTKAETEGLRKQLASVQSDLQSTQKAMAPGPKAKLTFSFVPFVIPPPHHDLVPVTDVKLPAASDGSVHVEFTVVNRSDANALNISLTLVICQGCKFAKEPAGYQKILGDKDTHRWMSVRALYVREFFRAMSVDIFPPTAEPFMIGFQYRCETCADDTTSNFGTSNFGTVHVIRDTSNSKPAMEKNPS